MPERPCDKVIESDGIKAEIKPTFVVLKKHEVQQLAANLANEECEKRFGKRPFLANSYEAQIKKGLWHWGYLDPVGVSGYSAIVSFQLDGSAPVVNVYFSTDIEDAGRY